MVHDTKHDSEILRLLLRILAEAPRDEMRRLLQDLNNTVQAADALELEKQKRTADFVKQRGEKPK